LAGLGVSLGNRLRLLKAAGTGATVMPPVSEAVAPIASASASAPATLASSLAPKMPPAAQRGNDVERRSLTVMFCDLADSTALSTRLDPEDLQDVIRAYQETCAKLIQEYSGYIAKYMGDGILVYFGYPKALERDAERAVRSAVAIVEAMAGLNQTVGRDMDVEIAVRIGIATATGIVMVGEVIGEGMAQERTVVGEAPNMAARNGIVIGALTKEITGDAFFYSEMEATELKGIAGLVKLWEVSGLHHDAADEDFFTGAEGNAEIPELVGRDEEIGLLRRAWQSVQEEARGQVVSISGEAGIGKSVLVDGQRAVVRAERQMQIALRS
jgi:class 3 adenylate cyclase